MARTLASIVLVAAGVAFSVPAGATTQSRTPAAGPAAKAKDAQPRFPLHGTAPTEGGALVGNSVVFLFGDLPAEVGTPSAKVHDETSKTDVAPRTSLSCRGERDKGRRCVVSVLIPGAVVGHRYRIEVLGHTLAVRAAPGHPGDRKR